MAAYSAGNDHWIEFYLYAAATLIGLAFWKFQPVQKMHKSLFAKSR